MDIYQISRNEIVCFACHDDLLLFNGNSGQKIKRIIDPTALKSSVFCTALKIYNSTALCAGSGANMDTAALSPSPNKRSRQGKILG